MEDGGFFPIAPGNYLRTVAEEDRKSLDQLCRTIHVLLEHSPRLSNIFVESLKILLNRMK